LKKTVFPAGFPLGIILLFILLSQPLRADACLNFLHEWIPFASGTDDVSTVGEHGLAEACFQFRKELSGVLASSSLSSAAVTLAGVTWGESEAIASEAQIARVLGALEQTWPASAVYRIEGAMFGGNESSSPASTAQRVKTPLFLTVNVSNYTADHINLLDFIFFDISIIRTVLREKVTATFRVFDSSGKLVYLNRLSVSPTIVFDVMFRPTVSLLSYFEKHDSRPWLLDYGEIFKDTASASVETRPEALRMPDFESSIKMPPPKQASPAQKEGTSPEGGSDSTR